MKNLIDKKIFIVDDDIFTCHVYTKHLNNLDFSNIQTYQSGVDCVNNLIEKPEIIFLDYQMEHLDGFETLKKIKRFDPEIFVIMVSGQTDMSSAIESLKFGAFDYIIKKEGDLDKITKTLNRISVLTEKIRLSKPSLISRIFNR